MKKNSVKHSLFRLVYILVLIGFCITGILLLQSQVEKQKATTFYTNLLSSPQKAVSAEATPSQEPEASLRVAALQQDYPDVVAWLSIPGTSVQYPVMQTSDNQTYLNHLPDGSYHASGSIFMDCRMSLASAHVILYGHNMLDGSMFGSLNQYLNPDYLQAHPEIYLYTAEKVWKATIFSISHVDAYDTEVYDPLVEKEPAMADFLQQCQAASLYPIKTGLAYDQVLTLSTCTEQSGTERLIVQAGMVCIDS